MINTLNDLKSGKLLGSKTLKLTCSLKKFPEEIFMLSSTLEILDLSDNELSELPSDINQLKSLKIIFFARNKFSVFPKILRELPNLEMIGFKSNNIETVPEGAFPPLLRWLILTDDKIKQIPKSIGNCHLLQKCAFAGNIIEELPTELSNCKNLELLRISANKLKVIPTWLFELPKLSWVAFGGNTASFKFENSVEIDTYDWKDLEVEDLLGEGASGLISRAFWKSKKKEVALKIFKGAVTSDGTPEDEMLISIAAGIHTNLIEVLGKLKNHPEEKKGLIMELISSGFINLGNPPTFETCTRDVFEENTFFDEQEVLKIAKSVASVCVHLHSKGINHGDLYAHNILIDTSAECILGDFGAASFYDLNSNYAENIERIEVRAYGCLIEDLLNQIKNEKQYDFTKWKNLIDACLVQKVSLRPNFVEISKKLESFKI